jgi:hypothetical protein
MRTCDGNMVVGVKESGGSSNNEGNGKSGKSNGNGIREGVDNGNKEGDGVRRRGQWQRRLVRDEEGKGEGGNKCNGDGDNTDVSGGNNVAGDNVSSLPPLSRQLPSSLLLPPQSPNAIALSAAIAAAVAIAHLFDTATKQQWHWQWRWKQWLRQCAIAVAVAIAHLFNTTIKQ